MFQASLNFQLAEGAQLGCGNCLGDGCCSFSPDESELRSQVAPRTSLGALGLFSGQRHSSRPGDLGPSAPGSFEEISRTDALFVFWQVGKWKALQWYKLRKKNAFEECSVWTCGISESTKCNRVWWWTAPSTVSTFHQGSALFSRGNLRPRHLLVLSRLDSEECYCSCGCQWNLKKMEEAAGSIGHDVKVKWWQ